MGVDSVWGTDMVSVPALAISVRPRQMGMVDEFCRQSLSCSHPNLLASVGLLLVTGALTLVVVAAIAHLSDAERVVKEEYRRTASERDAFHEFARRVASLDASATPVTAAQTVGRGATATAEQPPPDHDLEAVRDAYRDTVMAVPHYAEDYDEPLEVNMAAELGSEIATAVEEGGGFTPQLRGALMTKSRDAERKREDFLATLEDEAGDIEAAVESLHDADDDLNRLASRPLAARSYDDLVAAWDHLEDLERRLDRLIGGRQDAIHDSPIDRARGASVSLHEYLYQSLPVTYPVLASSASVLDRVRGAKRNVSTALTRRV